MRTLLLIIVSVFLNFTFNAQDGTPRGPYNTLDGGIIDGSGVIKDEVPIGVVRLRHC